MKYRELRRVLFYLVIIGFVLVSVQTGWNAVYAAKLEKNVIKVGYVGGMNFFFGKQMLLAAQDAAEEINKAGGVLGSKIEIVSADSGLTAAGATSAIAKLVTSDKVDYLIGAYTSEEATAFQSEASKYKKISLIHISTLRFDESYKQNPEANKYVFAVNNSEADTAGFYIETLPFVIKRLKNELGLKKINVALVSDNALWTVNIDKMMKEALDQYKNDINLVYQTKPARNATDFTTEITEFINKDVQLTIVFGGYGSMIPFTKQFKEMKVPALIFGAIVLAMTPDDFIKIVGPANASYVLCAGTGTEIASDRDAKMVKTFKAKHGAYPGNYASEGYNMIKLLAKGLENSKTMKDDRLIRAIEKAVIPAEQAWGGAVILQNHRIVYDYDLNKGQRKYMMQYSPDGNKTDIVFPESGSTAKLMIPPYLYNKWKK